MCQKYCLHVLGNWYNAGMSEFCDSARTELCAELAVTRRINKPAQLLYNFADTILQYCS